jgi:methanogenic corrinoid protein MtbC1
MPNGTFVEGYLQALLEGDRKACRRYVQRQLAIKSDDAADIYYGLLWPSMEQIDQLYRADRISTATEHVATRINRTIADQLQPRLRQLPSNGKRIIITCSDGEHEELGAQMCSDLFEARGWEVHFLGAGVPNDEILSLIGRLRPDTLVVFGAKPEAVPQVRGLVDLIRSVGCHPTMNIMISGGVFNRAEGLWREVRADLYAATAEEAIPLAEAAEPRTPEVVIAGAPKKRRRRRRATLLALAEA